MANIIVGIGDCKVSRDPADILITHALGSCIGVLVHDPVVRVAGLLHYMLPESASDLAKARRRPFAYADTGIPLLLQLLAQRGAVKSRMVIVAAGGAQMLDANDTFNIGKRNHLALRRLLWKAGVILHREEIGGTSSRTIRIEVATGKIGLRTAGEAEQELLAHPTQKGASRVFQHSYRG